MNYILFDDKSRLHLLPFTHTRPIADIRCGIMTMRERWEECCSASTTTLTEHYLQQVFPLLLTTDNVYVNGAIFGSPALAAAITKLEPGQTLVNGGTIIAARIGDNQFTITSLQEYIATLPAQHFDGEVMLLRRIWDIFNLNAKAIELDYAIITTGRKSAVMPAGITVTGKDLFIEEGANIYPGCIINTVAGPVYIGRDAEILEGTLIRGPLAVCEHGVIKMGAKIYGATTIGPGSKVGGEINNAVFFANSNKSHDGFLGNAVIGEWCNLGADTNCSNLKNNYDNIKIWDEATDDYISTGLTFCGLMMGDHSKSAINTMFNTGSVVGVSCNIFSGGFPDKYVPSFSWCGSEKMEIYQFEKAMETANRMMNRRGKSLNAEEMAMYRHIFDHSAHGN